MISDAEQHRDEDRRLRELTDARNQLDTAVYQVERILAERGDTLPVHEKARAENLVSDARQALKEDTPLERMRVLTDELQQVYMILGAPPTGPAPEVEPELPPSDGDDDVIDAEFTPSE
jgi:molecular chaperone DnaK